MEFAGQTFAFNFNSKLNMYTLGLASSNAVCAVNDNKHMRLARHSSSYFIWSCIYNTPHTVSTAS